MQVQMNDQVRVVQGRYAGRAGKVICLPPSREKSDLIVVLGSDERAFLCHAHECEQNEEINDGQFDGQD